jgi:hypothetical protein
VRLLLLALAEKTLKIVASGVSLEDLVSLRSVLCLCRVTRDLIDPSDL